MTNGSQGEKALIDFASDNASGASPEILAAVVEANQGSRISYGGDDGSRRLEKQFQDLFECDCRVFPVATGTAANVLALSVLTPPYGAIYCHELSHIHVDECGGPEFYSGGAKLIPMPGDGAKITARDLEGVLAQAGAGDVHSPQPAAVSLSQESELGTLYSLDELAEISEIAMAHHLAFHMDGARFANAVAALGCRPAEMTWKAGVDVLSFGASKNGALGVEAVVFFRPDGVKDFEYRRKRGGHLFSKMRYLTAQLEAYLADDLWLRNARHANAMAARLAEGLAVLPGVSLRYPVQANELFPQLPLTMVTGLRERGFRFYDAGPPERGWIRLVTAFNTAPEDIEAFLQAAAGLAEK